MCFDSNLICAVERERVTSKGGEIKEGFWRLSISEGRSVPRDLYFVFELLFLVVYKLCLEYPELQ